MARKRTSPDKVIAKAYLNVLDDNAGDEEAAAKQVGLKLEDFQEIIKDAKQLVSTTRIKGRRRRR